MLKRASCAQTPANENSELMKPEHKKYVIGFWAIFGSMVLAVVIFFSLLSAGVLGYMPSFKELENPKSNLASEILSADGKPLGRFYIENRSYVDYEQLSPNLVHALIATEDERFYEHSGIDFKSLFRVLFKTVLGGNESSGGGSTVTQQLAKMLFHDQASSLSERLLQKLNEWVIAVKLERAYTKEEIIAMYFNKVGYVYDAYGIESAAYTFFGTKAQDLTIEQAAVLVGMLKNPSYFNPIRHAERTEQRRNVVLSQMVKAKYLTQQECDSLQAIPMDCSKFKREDHKDGTAPYLREFLRLTLKAHKPERKNYASWQDQEFRDDSIQWENNPLYGWIDKNPKADGQLYDIYRDGLKIHTTIDSRMQAYAEQAVTEHIGHTLQPLFFKDKKGAKYAPYSRDITEEQFNSMVGRAVRNSDRWRIMRKSGMSESEAMAEMKKPVDMRVFDWKAEALERDTVMSPYDSVVYHKHFLRSGFMALDPHTGGVKAYVGGINFRYFQYDMVGKGRRQVGSTIKPFVYTTIFRDGHTPCDLVPNSPQTFTVPAEGGTTKTWTPRNSGDERAGEMVSLKWGLANSNNNVTGWAMKQTSPEQVANLIHALGVESHIDPVPSLFLGTSDVKLLEMVGAYATYVNKGVHIDPIFVTEIEDKYGNVIARFGRREREVIDEQTAYMMINLLEGVVNQGTGRRLRGPTYRLTCQMGGKTGTTQNMSDGWFMAVLPNLVCGVWVGGEERGIHFNSMSVGQASNMAIPVFGRFILKVYDDATLTQVRPTDIFEAPSTINFSLDCSDKNINADGGDTYADSGSASGGDEECEESGGIFDF